MVKKHPDDYARLKRQVCDAMGRVNASEPPDVVATAYFNDVIERNDQSARHRTNSGETMLRTKIRFLADLTELVRIETLVGEPLDAFIAFDAAQDRIVRLRYEVVEGPGKVARLRNKEVSGLEELTQRAARYARRDEFSRASFDQEQTNRFVPMGGGNHETKLGLYVRTDDNYNITERTVIKDVYVDNDMDNWDDSGQWQNADDPIDKVLTEAHVMERLRDTNSDNVVRLIEWQLHVPELAFRVKSEATLILLESPLTRVQMYIEYCPYGDLSHILNYHRTINHPVPEPFIWHIFESLVNVGLLMEQGDISQAQAGWTQIIHRDFKPANVFVGLHPQPVRNRNNWAGYPTIKLGDYSLAIETPSDPDDNPAIFLDEGTSGFQAPEQVHNPHVRPRDLPQLTDKTNVFGVGITVMSMMSPNRPVGVEDDWDAAHSGSRHYSVLPHFQDDVDGFYSEDLVQLVYKCVDYDQATRPSFAYLQREIWRRTRGPGALQQNDRASGMRASAVQETVSLGLTPDQYAIGTNLPPDDDDSDDEEDEVEEEDEEDEEDEDEEDEEEDDDL
jgi:serine/threonine protein kinase